MDWPRGISVFTIEPFEPCLPLTCKEILQNIMCTCARTFSLLAGGFAPNPYSSFVPGLHWGTSNPPVHLASLAALSGNECFWFSLRLWFSNDVCSSPNSCRITNQSPVTGPPGVSCSAGYQRHRFMAAGMTLTKILVLICLY